MQKISRGYPATFSMLPSIAPAACMGVEWAGSQLDRRSTEALTQWGKESKDSEMEVGRRCFCFSFLGTVRLM